MLVVWNIYAWKEIMEYTVRVDMDGTTEWYKENKLHREDGPAIECTNGYKEWYKEGKLHREDGPAIEHSDGGKYWYKEGELHREDGPAIEHITGYKVWYREGLHHREDGPAIEYSDGSKKWYLNEEELSEEEFNKRMNGLVCDRIVEIDGVKYRLVVI